MHVSPRDVDTACRNCYQEKQEGSTEPAKNQKDDAVFQIDFCSAQKTSCLMILNTLCYL